MHRRNVGARGGENVSLVPEEHKSSQRAVDHQEMSDNKVSAAEENEKKDPLDDTELGKFDNATGTDACCGPITSLPEVLLKLFVCALAGMIFGLALEKGRVYEPEAIRRQMTFDQWTMVKMFFSAMGVGQLVLALMSVIPHLRPYLALAHLAYVFSQNEMGVLRALIGPFILGVGMTVAGACPGMVLAQVGTNTTNGIYTLIGALVAALLFGMMGHYITRLITPKNKYMMHTVQDKTGIFYAWIAFPMSIIIIACAGLLEYFIPWEADLPITSRNPVNGTSNFLLLKSWPPTVSGAMIGCLQIVIVITVKDTLGSSSSYMTVMAQLLFHKKLQNMFPKLAGYRCGIGNWWQVVYVAFVMLGSFLSSFASMSTSMNPGPNLPTALIGGFLMLFGARIATGCTSGHGLSGTALLFWWSLIAVPVMFAGGIATAFGMRAFGVLDQYVCADGSICAGAPRD